MKYIYLIAFILISCQSLPLIIKEAEEIAVDEAIEMKVHKEKDSLNFSLDVKKEETSATEK